MIYLERRNKLIILQTIMGFIIIYLMFCLYASMSTKFNIETAKGFEHFCIVVGDFVLAGLSIILVLYLSYKIGEIIVFVYKH